MREQEIAVGVRQVDEVVCDAIDVLDRLSCRREEVIPTGIARLDAMADGLRSGEMSLFAARPGVGLTSFALAMARQMTAGDSPQRVGFISVGPDTAAGMVLRLLCNHAGVSLCGVRKGGLRLQSWDRIVAAGTEIKNVPLYMEAVKSLELPELRQKVETLVRRHDIRVLIVDGIQRIQFVPESRDQIGRDAAVAVSAGLREMADEFRVSIVALMTLPEERQSTECALTPDALQALGRWGHHADFTAVLHRPGTLWQAYVADCPQLQADLIVIENGLGGPLGTIKLEPFPDELVGAGKTDCEASNESK